MFITSKINLYLTHNFISDQYKKETKAHRTLVRFIGWLQIGDTGYFL